MPAANRPVNLAPAEFLTRLRTIEPGVWGVPCSVFLKDGRSFEQALVWENARFSDLGDWINPNVVASLYESPSRMPAQFARQLYDAGESGMGYHICIVELNDGTKFASAQGNFGIDFVNLPPGYTSKDIKRVFPHEGRERLLGEQPEGKTIVNVEFAT